MAILSICLNEEEYKILSAYAKKHGISMNKALKDAFFEKLEDEYDIKLFEETYENYLKDNKTYTTEEVCEELNIKL